MTQPLPGKRRLLQTWAVLMALTGLSMCAAQLGGEGAARTLPLWSAGLLLLSTGFKAHQVAMVYLNLRASGSSWRGAWLGLLLLTLAVIAAGYLAVSWSHPASGG
ncbi:cytochrome C oxidase subunit IV family protein [Alkalilimnicola ehrlichii MLHE-1]|uniref:Cytochrome C oxidase subunit IV n=1 Tax=Alkalilimnicola ehrlichii (strain ATCC BAA-1101 / DSM 17681 / MLHE-1) TaxID=187272 RepID=Q0A6T0_ALKEH|nr:cytochrome C oxidase subunit IV family protein [Alkalilimnicola ehrlichii]ABI57457.1 conserved hypothetical protein [Alkalilimnicola ehrlichii MLHE-1]